MAHSLSAKKRVRQSIKRRARNRHRKELVKDSQKAFSRLARSKAELSPAERAALVDAARSTEAALKAAPQEVTGRQPVTLGVGEPLGTTLTVSFYIAVLFALPLILYELYAFVMPAFDPRERRIVRPLISS